MNADPLMNARVYWFHTDGGEDDDGGWYWSEQDETGADFGEPVGPFESAIHAAADARAAIIRRSSSAGPTTLENDK